MVGEGLGDGVEGVEDGVEVVGVEGVADLEFFGFAALVGEQLRDVVGGLGVAGDDDRRRPVHRGQIHA